MAQRKTPTRSRSKPGTDTKPRSGAGCLIWFILLLMTLFLFVLSWDRIRETISSTGFAEAFPDRRVAPAKDPELLPKEILPDSIPEGDGSAGPGTAPQAVPTPPVAAPAPAGTIQTGPTQPGSSQPPVRDVPEAMDHPADKPVVTPMEQVQTTRIASLYFIQVDDDGAISRHEVKRTVNSSDFPLTDALNALLAGPSAEELSRNYITLIPSGTRLLSAQVRGSTAYVDFSEAFMYNRYGIEGYAGQLKQVVYTATSFPTVKDVQILIEGSKRDFLGGEGVFIGKPLARASF
ncbi:MAG: GerMN domain-containing protein [Spirochaetota bacterium]